MLRHLAFIARDAGIADLPVPLMIGHRVMGTMNI
jgi:hypothetical protein